MTVVLAVPGHARFATPLCTALGAESGTVAVRRFPDGETHVRIDTDVAGREVVLVCGLEHAAQDLLTMAFLAGTARDLGAKRVGLVAPYLSFMRQDSRFHPGEGVTSIYFARLLSGLVDWLCTVDPHLHRWSSLEEVYRIPTEVVHAAPAIAAWIREHVPSPVLIGPDAESEQWVGAVARALDAPCVVLEKTRRGDRDVSVSIPALEDHGGRTPVVLDDIISTGRTMIETLRHLPRSPVPVCVGIHAVMAEHAYADLISAGAAQVVTCDTIHHATNRIATGDLLADGVRRILAR